MNASLRAPVVSVVAFFTLFAKVARYGIGSRRHAGKGFAGSNQHHQTRELLAEGKPLEQSLVSADGLTEEKVLRFLAEAFEVPYVENEYLEKTPPQKDFLTKFPVRLLLKHQILPLEERDGFTIVATSKISDHNGLDELRLASGRDILPALATASEIDRALKKILGVGADTLQSLEQTERTAGPRDRSGR